MLGVLPTMEVGVRIKEVTFPEISTCKVLRIIFYYFFHIFETWLKNLTFKDFESEWNRSVYKLWIKVVFVCTKREKLELKLGRVSWEVGGGREGGIKSNERKLFNQMKNTNHIQRRLCKAKEEYVGEKSSKGFNNKIRWNWIFKPKVLVDFLREFYLKNTRNAFFTGTTLTHIVKHMWIIYFLHSQFMQNWNGGCMTYLDQWNNSKLA